MPLNYDQETRITTLSPVLELHTAWFNNVIRQIFFPEEKQDKEGLQLPQNFSEWLDGAYQNHLLTSEETARLHQMRMDVGNAADELMRQTATTKERPRLHQFDAFLALYGQIVSHIREIEQKQSLAASGIDQLTGLRNQAVMKTDIGKEMELLARRGRPFSLVLARIDNYDVIRKNLPDDQHDHVVQRAGAIIKLCIRSFDDAYRLENGEFLMCLKQAEKSGGSASVNRLRKLLEENPMRFRMKNEEITLTMSSCVAEPQPGDQVDDLLNNMRADMDKYGGGTETQLEYFEMSPLQRFLSGEDAPSSKKTN